MEQGDLSAAIIAYLGYKQAAWPQADWRAVVGAIGRDRAAAVEIPMLGVLAELNEQQPDWRLLGLYGGSEWAVRQVRGRHPDIDDRAAKALVWKFSYENE